MICIDYKDKVELIDPKYDAYGSETPDTRSEVQGLFIQNTGFSHGINADTISADATLYVDPTNAFVLANYHRLEGMLVIANPIGGEKTQSWYRISDVRIGRDNLITNKIQTVVLSLRKSTGIENVS